MFVTIGALVLLASAMFTGSFSSYVPVTLTADRAGLVMESGGKVKMRGVQVGRVSQIHGSTDQVSIQLHIFPDQAQYIPANVQARIRATTAFGAKYVDLVYPEHPSAQRISPGQTLRSENVSTEVNTVFQNLVKLLDKVDTSKLNAAVTAIADGVRGKGPRIGEATSAANDVLIALNDRADTIRADWKAFAGFSDTYSSAAPDIITTLDAASTTSQTITNNASALEALMLSVAGFSNSGIALLAPSQDNLVQAVNTLEPTTALLLKYNPEYACTLLASIFRPR